jgi:hypothetical protein
MRVSVHPALTLLGMYPSSPGSILHTLTSMEAPKVLRLPRQLCCAFQKARLIGAWKHQPLLRRSRFPRCRLEREKGYRNSRTAVVLPHPLPE